MSVIKLRQLPAISGIRYKMAIDSALKTALDKL